MDSDAGIYHTDTAGVETTRVGEANLLGSCQSRQKAMRAIGSVEGGGKWRSSAREEDRDGKGHGQELRSCTFPLDIVIVIVW